MHRLLLALGLFLLTASSIAAAQAGPPASRLADLQVGVGYSGADSDYVVDHIRGIAFYASLDVTNHWGGEVDFHQLNDPQPSKVYERTYEIGPRYVLHYGRFHPYGKVLYGRGVFNFPQNVGNLAYNMFVGGAGVDINVLRRVNVRADYEYQKWLSGPGLTNGLSPQVVTIGVAYHFPAGRAHGIR
ncbi:MAG: outer membrane beta-barrel protein [Acidobacteriaceae bacterium]|nr:outer membrane beta-barrel protein [Acidobacteriaceae bacterium]